MSYKVKSLVYLFCFVASAIIYYNLDQDFRPLTPRNSTEVAKVDSHKVSLEKKAEADEVQ